MIIGGMGEEVDPMAMVVLSNLPALVNSAQLQINVMQYVGADNYIHKLTFVMNGAVDTATLLAITTGRPPQGESLATITIVFDVELSQFNQPLQVTAPQGATPASAEEIGPLLEQFAPIFGIIALLGLGR